MTVPIKNSHRFGLSLRYVFFCPWIARSHLINAILRRLGVSQPTQGEKDSPPCHPSHTQFVPQRSLCGVPPTLCYFHKRFVRHKQKLSENKSHTTSATNSSILEIIAHQIHSRIIYFRINWKIKFLQNSLFDNYSQEKSTIK